MLNKKPHKFFDFFLDNNLEELNQFLLQRKYDLASGQIPGVGIDQINQAGEEYKQSKNPQRLDRFYNVFQFSNDSIYNLYKALRSLTKEACEYYEIDYDSSQFMIHGWFNVDSKKDFDKKTSSYHDHSGGKGAPYFHGYYCVNAEPSSTFYKINREEPFENVNKNNRAILSETGHPHAIGGFDFGMDRITIAYDISPLNLITGGGHEEQIWIPLG